MLCLLLTLSAALPTQEPSAPPRLDAPVRAVALFKNGLAVVRRSVSLPGRGTYDVGEVPAAVHGTLWIDSPAVVEVRATEVREERPFDGRWEHDPQGALAGALVALRMKDPAAPPISGRVVEFAGHGRDRAWGRGYEPEPPFVTWAPGASPDPSTSGAARRLALSSGGSTFYVDLAEVSVLEVREPPPPSAVVRPGLRLAADGVSEPVEVDLSYLAKGLSFAPSYRLALLDGETLEVAQSAVLRNELEDLVDVDVRLVTGFPNMPFSHVVTPLSPLTSWQEFFQELGREPGEASGGGAVMMQNFAAPVAPFEGAGAGLGSDEGGVDLHYQPLGQMDLREGEALQVSVARARAEYERIVEWTVPDARDEWGRISQSSSYGSSRGRGEESDEPWDALRFENPLDFPMTTAPAMVVEGPRFLGQQMVSWTAPGEEAVVRITKALSIRTGVVEYELEDSREEVARHGWTFRRALVRGEVLLTNYRAESARIVVRRRFSGELEAVDGEPRTRLLERGVYSVNPRRELVWTLDLAPGEARTLTYTYGVLVRR